MRYNVPGATGPIGPLVYPAGEYDAATKYIRTSLSAPMVLDDGQYYVLNKEGAFTGIRPKDDYAQTAPGRRVHRMRVASDLVFLFCLPGYFYRLFQYVWRNDYTDTNPAVAVCVYVYHPAGRGDQRDPGRIWIYREAQG